MLRSRRCSPALLATCTALGLGGSALGPARADDGTQSPATPATAPPLPQASEVDGEIDDWPAGHAPPPGYRWDSKPHALLANIGAGLFALGYVPAFAIAAAGNDDLLHPGNPRSLWLFAPIAGPFVLLGDARNDFASVLLITDGVFQAVGVGLAAVGLLWRIPILVRSEKSTLRIEATPLVLGKRGGALRLEGTF
jgi:hypothetical protein